MRASGRRAALLGISAQRTAESSDKARPSAGRRLRDALVTWREETLPKLPDQFKNAAPTSAFFIALFWLTVILFGMDHVMAVSCYTTLFNVRCRKYNAPSQYLRFFLVTLLALAAARAATLNLPLCIAVNLAMPFVFVFMRSSQLNPRRYFPYMMLFMFLQLRPELLDNLGLQAAALLFNCAVLTVALLIAGVVLRKADESVNRLHQNIRRLAGALQYMADNGIDQGTRPELLKLRADFSELAYAAREDSSAPDLLSNLFDMFAALAQRTAYLVGRLNWQTGDQCANAPYLRELADLTRDVDRIINTRDNRILTRRAEALLADADAVANDRFRLFYRSYLRMLILILRDAEDPHQVRWRLSTANQLRVSYFRKHPSLDSFEMRFSIRCGVVLAVSCGASLALPVDHLYWFPLTAFLLLQPFATESIHRTYTRTVGTVLGSVAVYLLGLLNLPYEGVMVLGMVLITCLYSSTPGSSVLAFFATTYALSLASFSIGDRYAIGMRLICLAAAGILVVGVNRLVVPTSDRTLFLANVRQLFGMVERYWELIRKSLHERMDAAAPCEALLHFQMVHTQAAHYIEGLPVSTEQERGYKLATQHVLFCLWELICELEQLELLVRMGDIDEAEYANLELFERIASDCCQPFAYDKRMGPAEDLLDRFQEEDVRYVLQQYLLRAKWLADALEKARGLIGEKPSYVEEVRDVA